MSERQDEEDDDSSSSSSYNEDEEDEEEVQQQEQHLHVVVRRVGEPENETLEIMLDADASVLDLKQAIFNEMKEKDDNGAVPVERQRLIFSGKMLRDETEHLVEDLNMKPGDDKKHFVHLTPLPNGIAPSKRTERELTPEERPSRSNAHQRHQQQQQQQQQQGARSVGSRQRRRRRTENPRASGAYHPYALSTPPAPRSSTAAVSTVARGMTTEQQAQLAALTTDSLIASHGAAAAAAAAFGLGGVASGGGNSNSDHLYCPYAAVAGLGATPTSALTLMHYQQQQEQHLQLQLQQQLQQAGQAHPLLLQGGTVAAAASSDSQLGLLQDILALGPQEDFPDLLDRIAQNAGELADTLRQQAAAQAAATPGSTSHINDLYSRLGGFDSAGLGSPAAAAAATTTVTPMSNSLEERLNAVLAQQSLEERLQALTGGSPPYATFGGAAFGSSAGFFPF